LIARDGKPHWSIEAHLLDNLRMVQTGSKDKPPKPHPMRPTGEKRRRDTPDRQRKLAAARNRARARRRAIEAGEIT
jgi:hypothetical protein